MRVQVLLLALLAASCENQNSSKSVVLKNQDTLLDNIVVNNEKKTVVDGYKNFRFGMTSVELAQTAACTQSYSEQTGLARLEYQIKEAKDRLSYSTNLPKIKSMKATISRITAAIEANQSLVDRQHDMNNPQAVRYYERELADAKSLLQEKTAALSALEEEAQNEREHPETRYESEVQPLMDQYQKIKNIDPYFANKWINDPRTFCSVELMGLERNVRLNLNGEGKLSKVTISLGDFADETYQSISQKLSEKYQLNSEPDQLQISLLNQGRIDRVARVFEGGQVVVSVYNHLSNGVPKRYLELVYADKELAVELTKSNVQGKLTAEDL